MVKILHIGDVHLDHPFGKYSETIRKKLSMAQQRAFESAIDMAIKEEVDALLIAGDLFHGKTWTYKTEQLLKASFKRLNDNQIPCVYATGNHDPMVEMKPFMEKEVKGLSILGDDEIQSLSFVSKDMTPFKVVGCGHKEKGETRSLIQGFPQKESCVTFGLAHSMVGHVSEEEKEPYMPVSLPELLSKDYDYFALGHIHKAMVFEDTIAYSGCIQGVKIKETGPKGGHLVRVDSYGTHIDFVELSEIQMCEVEVDIEGAETMDDLETLIIKALPDLNISRIQCILRINLKGITTLYSRLTKEGLETLSEMVETEGFLHVSIKAKEVKRKRRLSNDHMTEGMIRSILEVVGDLDGLCEQLFLKAPFKNSYDSKETLKIDVAAILKESKEDLLELMVKYDG